MPFRSSHLRRKELRLSVIRLWRKRKQRVHAGEPQVRDLASQCRQDTAVMLGFGSWAALLEDFDQIEHRQAVLAAKDLYPDEPQGTFTPQQAQHFMDWLSQAGAIDMFIAVDKSIHFYWLGECHASHNATQRHLTREDVMAFMAALGFEQGMLEKLRGKLTFRRHLPGPCGQILCWLAHASMGEEHASVHLTIREQSLLPNPFPNLPIFTPDQGLVLLASPHSNHLSKDIDGLMMAHPLMQALESVIYQASDGRAWHEPRQTGRFWGGLAHKNTYTQKAMAPLQSQPHIVDIRRCIDGETLNNASLSAAERPVYLGLCGDMSNVDPGFQRASTSLVSAMEMFDPKDWKTSALQLFETLTMVYCRVRPAYFRDSMAESLVFDAALRERCRQQVELAEQPGDMLSFLAKEVLLQGNTFLNSDKIKSLSPAQMGILHGVEQAWNAPIKAQILHTALTHPEPTTTAKQRL